MEFEQQNNDPPLPQFAWLDCQIRANKFARLQFMWHNGVPYVLKKEGGFKMPDTVGRVFDSDDDMIM